MISFEFMIGDSGVRDAGSPLRDVGENRDSETKNTVKKIFICSPYHPRGATKDEKAVDLKNNISLAKLASMYVIRRGGIPYAPHLYFPQMLSEDVDTEREIGIQLGLKWLAECDELWVIGYRISEGMKREIQKAKEWGIPVKIVVPSATQEEYILLDLFEIQTIIKEIFRVQKGEE